MGEVVCEAADGDFGAVFDGEVGDWGEGAEGGVVDCGDVDEDDGGESGEGGGDVGEGGGIHGEVVQFEDFEISPLPATAQLCKAVFGTGHVFHFSDVGASCLQL